MRYGAVFEGRVVANSSVADTLVLQPGVAQSGTATGLLNGLGTALAGFTNLTEQAGAKWDSVFLASARLASAPRSMPACH